jgi:periplasmic divalent cation tolerance protein
MAGYIQITTTTSSKHDAERIADTLIGKRLAGCVQISGPMKSAFVWKGKKEQANEWICFIKTSESNYSKIEREIRKIHKYSVPEILSFRIDKGNQAYLKWLGDSLGRV